MSNEIPTVEEYAALCERVAIAKLILKNGRFPTRSETDSELRWMDEPSTDGITRRPVISKANCAALMKTYNVGTLNSEWQASKIPTTGPAKASAPAIVTPKASTQRETPGRRAWAQMKRDDAFSAVASSTPETFPAAVNELRRMDKIVKEME